MLNPLKFLDRRRKREFYKNQKSLNWQKLSTEFLQMCKNEKANYYANIVHYLKVSNPGKWYLQEHRNKKTPNVGPYKVFRSLKKMNRNATVSGDLPIKIICR